MRRENWEGGVVGAREVAEIVEAVAGVEDDAVIVKLQDAMPPWWRIVLESQARYASTSE